MVSTVLTYLNVYHTYLTGANDSTARLMEGRDGVRCISEIYEVWRAESWSDRENKWNHRSVTWRFRPARSPSEAKAKAKAGGFCDVDRDISTKTQAPAPAAAAAPAAPAAAAPTTATRQLRVAQGGLGREAEGVKDLRIPEIMICDV